MPSEYKTPGFNLGVIFNSFPSFPHPGGHHKRLGWLLHSSTANCFLHFTQINPSPKFRCYQINLSSLPPSKLILNIIVKCIHLFLCLFFIAHFKYHSSDNILITVVSCRSKSHPFLKMQCSHSLALNQIYSKKFLLNQKVSIFK